MTTSDNIGIVLRKTVNGFQYFFKIPGVKHEVPGWTFKTTDDLRKLSQKTLEYCDKWDAKKNKKVSKKT